MEWVNERSTRSKTTNRTIGTQNTALHTEQIASTHGKLPIIRWLNLSFWIEVEFGFNGLSEVICLFFVFNEHKKCTLPLLVCVDAFRWLSVLIFFALSSLLNKLIFAVHNDDDADKFSIFNFLFPHCCYDMSTWVWNRQFIHNSFVINLFSRYFSFSLRKILFCFLFDHTCLHFSQSKTTISHIFSLYFVASFDSLNMIFTLYFGKFEEKNSSHKRIRKTWTDFQTSNVEIMHSNLYFWN